MTQQARQLFDKIPQPVLRFLQSSSSSSSSLSKTQQVHAHMTKSGIQNDAVFSTKLIALYSNNSCFSDANLVLESIPDPTVHSFSALIYAFTKSNLFGESLLLFSRMISRGLAPDSHILPNLFKACAGLSSLRAGKQIHCVASVSGCDFDPFVLGSLVHMYLRCHSLSDARKVFDRIPQKDVVICSALLAGYARKGYLYEIVNLLVEMENSGVELNLVSWNGLISGFNHSGHYKEAIGMFRKMHLEGFRPDEGTISSVLPAIGDLEKMDLGKQVHGYVIKQGFKNDKCVISALVDMHGKCGLGMEMMHLFDEMELLDTGVCNAYITGLSRNGLIDKALEMFEHFKVQGVELNVVSWTSIIAGCSQNGKDMEALDLFREMQIAGVRPNAVTIPSMLPACGNIAALVHGKAAHGYSVRTGISDDVHVGSALIDMYAKCGRIATSRVFFDKLPVKNLVCWNSIMGGYAMHGKAKEVISIFEDLQKSGLKPDFITFTCLLAACGQAGLTEEGRNYFSSMSNYGIEPRLEHYACMVTLLGRAGELRNALDMIEKMPYEPDACVWGALLSACRVHNNLDIGEAAAKELFELEPTNPGNYVLLSNIYATKGMFNEVDKVRGTMNSLGLKKNPGCSWIQVKNKIHMLLAGDTSLPEIDRIREKLVEISMEMKKSGYHPNTDLVLQDVEEQEKEQILCGHSEKLAVVFGLLNIPSGSPLQVIKNLRICGDCHSVIKFISGYASREIFVRDTNRFHHFKDGNCSCGDFW